MPARSSRPTAIGALLLLAAMLTLLLHGPRLTAENGDGPDVVVRCGSLLTVGWPTDHSDLDSDTSRSYGDHVVTGDPDFSGIDGIARDCSERRDLRA